MVRLTWSTPPESNDRRKRGDKRRIDREVQALRRNPGKWALLQKDASAGAYVTYKRRGVTTRTKYLQNQRYTIWGMWDPASKEAKAWMKKYDPDGLEEQLTKEAEGDDDE